MSRWRIAHAPIRQREDGVMYEMDEAEQNVMHRALRASSKLIANGRLVDVIDALGSPVVVRKKPAALTPRSLALLRAEGWQAAVVEHWNSFVRIRQDLFGWCDVLGVGKEGTIAVQVCRRADMSTRAKKIADSDTIGPVRDAGWRIEVHGWDLYKGRWRVERRDIS